MSLWNKDIIAVKESELLLQKLVSQLNKDFRVIDFSAHDSLVLFVEKIKIYLKTNPNAISDLLYRIDVDEKRVSAMLLAIEDFHEALAVLILQREAQKVLFKQQWGGK